MNALELPTSALEFTKAGVAFFKIWDSYDYFQSLLQTKLPGHPPTPFPQWPFFQEVITLLNEGRKKKICKGRQIMVTWLVCSWILWYALTKPGSLQLIISKREKEVWHLIDRIKFLFDNLRIPALSHFWTFPRDSRSELKISLAPELQPLLEDRLQIKWNDSNIIGLPATEAEGRTYNPDHAFIDEAGWVENLEEILDGLDANCDHITVVSTPPPFSSYFEAFFNVEDEFVKLKLPWNVRPDRNEAWKQRKIRALKSAAKFAREHECQFIGRGGKIFQHYNPETQLFTRYPPKTTVLSIFGGIDFGFDDPFVCQWWATDGSRYWLLHEYRQASVPLRVHAEKILRVERALKKFYNLSDGPIRYYCGPAEKQERKELESYGVTIISFSYPVELGEIHIDDLFAQDLIRIQKFCIWFQSECEIYSRETRGTNNHSIDAARYALLGYSQQKGSLLIASVPKKKQELSPSQRARVQRRERRRRRQTFMQALLGS